MERQLRYSHLKRIFLSTRTQALVLFAFALLFFTSFYENVVFTIFQGRDIRRAAELLEGHLIWHGPDLSAGGYAPGPFYYWLLALPLSLFGTWESLVWFNFFLMSGAAVILWFVGKSLKSVFAGFLLYFLFLNSPQLTDLMKVFWNPSFLFIFQALLVYMLILLPKDKKLLPVIGLVIGLSVQIHYLQSIFLLALLASVLISNQRTEKKLTDLTVAGCFTFLPLLPYLIWSLGNIPQQKGESFPNPLVYSFLNPFETLGRIGGNLSEVVSESFAPILLVVWIFAAMDFLRKKKISYPKNNLLLWAWVFSLVAWFPFAYDLLFPRYTAAFVLLTYVLSAPMIEWLEEKHRRYFFGALLFVVGWYFYKTEGWRYFSQIFGVFPFFFLSCAAAIVFLFPLPVRHRSALALLFLITLFGFLNKLSQGEAGVRRKTDTRAIERSRLLDALAEETGWDYKTFRERTFIAGSHREDEFQFIYKQSLSKIEPRAHASTLDGILVVSQKMAKFLNNVNGELKPNWEQVRSTIPDEFYFAGISGELICRKTANIKIFDVCYYEFKAPEKSMTWNNLGYPYLFRQPALTSITKPQGVERPNSSNWVFYTNTCKNFDPACSIYFLVRSMPAFLEVTVLGDPLGVPNPIPNPVSYLTLEDLNLEVLCPGGKPSISPLASRMGIALNANGAFTQGFLTPYQQVAPLKCKNPDRVAVFSDKVKAGSIYGGQKPSPFRIEWTKTKL